MIPLLLLEIAGAFALGVASHVFIFIHGELDRYAAAIILLFAIAYLVLVVFMSLQEGSILAGIIFANILFTCFQTALGGSITIYRLFFHRVRHFRGPKLSAVSKWDAVDRARRNAQYHLQLVELHLKHGDYVRTGNYIWWNIIELFLAYK
jgi:hypothetical protein